MLIKQGGSSYILRGLALVCVIVVTVYWLVGFRKTNSQQHHKFQNNRPHYNDHWNAFNSTGFNKLSNSAKQSNHQEVVDLRESSDPSSNKIVLGNSNADTYKPGVLDSRVSSHLVKNIHQQQRLNQEFKNEPPVTSKRGLIVLPIFPLLLDPSYNLSGFKANISRHKLEERMADFVESLQKTLNHTLVSKVILLHDQDVMRGYIRGKVGSNPKLSFVPVNETYYVAPIFQYVHENLQDELVMVSNGDIYPDKGFDLINYDLLKSKKLFYSPTRHGAEEKRCSMGIDYCDPGSPYNQAHDAYIFVPMGQLGSRATELMKGMRWDHYGYEHVLLYVYHLYLHYKVLNPCHVIFVYHNHCSRVRHLNKARGKFGSRNIYYDVRPSSNLQ